MTLHDPHETRRKRLLWRATRRGIKEMDLIVGGFAAANLAGMDSDTLDAFERLLDIPDTDLLAYATNQATIPLHLKSALLEAVLVFRPDVTR
ncbi:MAG: succinate dehydrogenase assembly factor 2 [Phyllobacteriaceae bacterium]|jgi:antitoxin CptB|nr:succinate dehydrogenase assembly factor 2 [Phyllobacteriaceae bacterium]